MIPRVMDSRQMLVAMVRRWPRIFAAGILGGLLGIGLSRILPPIYEAVTVVGTGVDPARALPMDDDTRRMALDHVRQVFLADETLEAVRRSPGVDLEFSSVNALRSTLRLSETSGAWELGVRNASAESAALLANRWSQISVQALQTAAAHAWKAADLQAQWYMVGCRLVTDATQPALAVWECAKRPEAYDPEQALTEIQTEAVLSRGILPSMSFSVLQEAGVPTSPLTQTRGMLALAGSLASVILACVAAAAWPSRNP